MPGGLIGTDLQIELPSGARPATAAYARRRIGLVLAGSGERIDLARLRIRRDEQPGRLPILAQISLDVRGRPVRVQARAAGERDAIDRLEARLRDRLDRLGGLESGHRHGHLEPPAVLPEVTPDVVTRLRIVVLDECSIDEAIAELDYLDHHFLLFVERGSGRDSVLSRRGDGYRLQQLDPRWEQVVQQGAADVELGGEPVPVLSLPDAVRRLSTSTRTFLFFHDQRRDRGSVVYRRYDGTFGALVALH